MRRVFAALVVAAAVTGAVPAAAAVPDRRLPPSARADLARIFDPRVHDLGFRTTRALLQNLETYAADPKGRHLAIYLEPIADDFPDGNYVERFTKVAQVFLPLVFDRWKGLKSFDVCLEPVASDDPRPEPAPMTQLLVTRRGVRALDWSEATLVDVLVAADKHNATDSSDADLYVYFQDRLDTVPELSQAREASTER